MEKNFGPLQLRAPDVAKSGHPLVKATQVSERRDDIIQSSTARPSDQNHPIVGPRVTLEVCDMPSKHSKLALWVLSGLLSRLSE